MATRSKIWSAILSKNNIIYSVAANIPFNFRGVGSAAIRENLDQSGNESAFVRRLRHKNAKKSRLTCGFSYIALAVTDVLCHLMHTQTSHINMQPSNIIIYIYIQPAILI